MTSSCITGSKNEYAVTRGLILIGGVGRHSYCFSVSFGLGIGSVVFYDFISYFLEAPLRIGGNSSGWFTAHGVSKWLPQCDITPKDMSKFDQHQDGQQDENKNPWLLNFEEASWSSRPSKLCYMYAILVAQFKTALSALVTPRGWQSFAHTHRCAL